MKRKSLLLTISLLFLLAACKYSPLLEPQIYVSQANIGLNPGRRSANLIIRNMGQKGSVLKWSLEAAKGVSADRKSGSLEFGEKSEIFISLTAEAIGKKEAFVAEIKISSNDVEKIVFVYFRPNISSAGLKNCGSSVMINSLGSSKNNSSNYVADELLIKYVNHKNIIGSTGIDTLNNKYGLLTVKEGGDRASLVKIPNTKDPAKYAELVAKDPRVEYAEPNYYLKLLSIPNDPLYSEQWNLKEFGLEQAWDIESGNNRVVIAIIDSSVDTKQEDLASKILPGCDFNNNDNNPNPGPSNGGKSEHGTHVAGIAAAIGNNGKGVAGVAYGPGIKILPIKIFDDAGISGTIDSLIDGILWASGYSLPGVGKNPNPADIINMSVGVNGSAIQDRIKSINDATAKAAAKGVIMFAATGNSGSNSEILYPAAANNVIAVGSVDQNLQRSDFSNFNNNGASVDLVAPGGFSNSNLCSSTPRIRSSFPNNKYGCLSGTSMAAPFVSGVAALMLSQDSTLSPAEIKAKLFSSALYTAEMNKAEYGAGIVCADKALGATTRCGH